MHMVNVDRFLSLILQLHHMMISIPSPTGSKGLSSPSTKEELTRPKTRGEIQSDLGITRVSVVRFWSLHAADAREKSAYSCLHIEEEMNQGYEKRGGIITEVRMGAPYLITLCVIKSNTEHRRGSQIEPYCRVYCIVDDREFPGCCFPPGKADNPRHMRQYHACACTDGFSDGLYPRGRR